MLVQLSGIVTVSCMFEQLLKASAPILVHEDKSTLERSKQPEKANAPIVLTWPKFISRSSWQPLNALSPIDLQLAGKVTFVIYPLLEKAPSPISVT